MMPWSRLSKRWGGPPNHHWWTKTKICQLWTWLGTALPCHDGWHSHGKMLGLDDGEESEYTWQPPGSLELKLFSVWRLQNWKIKKTAALFYDNNCQQSWQRIMSPETFVVDSITPPKCVFQGILIFVLVFNLHGTRLWRLFHIPLMQIHIFYIPHFWKRYVYIHRYANTTPTWNPTSTCLSTPHYVPVFKNWNWRGNPVRLVPSVSAWHAKILFHIFISIQKSFCMSFTNW